MVKYGLDEGNNSINKTESHGEFLQDEKLQWNV